ncbi:hypothetical protein VTK73DRAFT_1783 [Phialemonium thermophilum]|uniref:EKC/KEOPS complex subunit BUD32 n=1 Tax=Phialemonium thermophilum TaxID=223376 RepID=A0ABR3X8J9_9PEZI
MQGGDHICLPIDDFIVHGPNGRHICLVYPVLGPSVDSVIKIFHHAPEKTLRELSRQIVESLIALHDHGICHADLRPANILLQLKSLDGRTSEDILDLLGEPETAEVVVRDASGADIRLPQFPRYLVYSNDFADVDLDLVTKHVFVTDLGQSFDVAEGGARKDFGIPRPYCPPEIVCENSAGISMDLWSLGCVLFEARLGEKLFDPSDISGPDDDEYLIAVTLILGKLPEPWWTNWDQSSHLYEAGSGGPHSRLVEIPGRLCKRVPDPRSIKEKILACRARGHPGRQEDGEVRNMTDEEVALFADLLEKLLRYAPDERMPAREAINHGWFTM